MTMSFEVWATRVPLFEVYGTGGTIAVADPNTFDGVTSVATAGEREFTEVRPLAGHAEAGRGIGLADLARGLETGRPHRADGTLGYHVLEVMEAIATAAGERRTVEIESTCERQEPVALN